MRTLPAALSPVFAGSAVAAIEGGFSVWKFFACLIVALGLQIGVNFANDYSDGVRGTDAHRVGPQRLVGSGAASPGQVKAAAWGCFALSCVVGFVLVASIGAWWLLAVGVACVAAAWFYTGGKHPYGYHGLGEVFVFIFFGLVAVVGTTYVQLQAAPASAWVAAVTMGALSCAILVCNNLRDLENDRASGKKTLETILGDTASRWLYAGLGASAIILCAVFAAMTTWWALLSLTMLSFIVPAIQTVLAGRTGMPLVVTLKNTGLAELTCGMGMFVGCVVAAGI